MISISLIVWFFLNIDLQNTLQLVATTNILPLIFCIISLAVLVIPAAIRWRWFVGRLMPDGMAPPDLGMAIRINTVNVALNQFLPSTLGGDLYRVIIAKSLGLSLLRSTGATVADRLSAFVILIVISGPALIITLLSLGRHCLAAANDHMADVGGCDRAFSALLGFYPKACNEICVCICAIPIFFARKWPD